VKPTAVRGTARITRENPWRSTHTLWFENPEANRFEQPQQIIGIFTVFFIFI